MYFKISDDIRRETNFDMEDIRKIDEYLARPNRKQFDLFSVESHQGLGIRAKPILNEYIERGAVSGPTTIYICPVHGTKLELVSKQYAKCIDCDKLHLCENCNEETVYERTMDPMNWPPSDGTTLILPPAKPEKPWWTDRKWQVTTLLAVIAIVISVLDRCTPNKTESDEISATSTELLTSSNTMSMPNNTLNMSTLTQTSSMTSRAVSTQPNEPSIKPAPLSIP